MPKFNIKVTDRRGKFEPRVYTVEAEQEFLAYGEATKKFISDNGIPPRKPTQRISVYFSRFWNEKV